MTHPVQEPSTQREVSKLGFGERQLFRRPADQKVIGYPYIYREHSVAFGVLSVPDGGAGVSVNFNVLQNEGATYFSTISATETRILARGGGSNAVFHFTAQIKWDTLFAGITSLRVNCGAFGNDVGIEWEEPGGAGGNGSIAPVLDFRRRIDTAANSAVFLQVQQYSGTGAKNLLSAFLEIAVVHEPFLGAGNSY